MNQPEQIRERQIREWLRELRVKGSECPFQQIGVRQPKWDQDCPRCGADNTEACRQQVRDDSWFVSNVRELLGE